MQVLLTSVWPLPHEGGLSTYVDLLKEGLENYYGDRVSVFATDPQNVAAYYADGIMVGRWDKLPVIRELDTQYGSAVRTAYPMLPKYVWIHERERLAYWRILETLNLDVFDVIHAQDPIAVRAIRAVKSSRTRLVLTLHSDLVAEKAEGDHLAEDSFELNYWASIVKSAVAASDATIMPSEWLCARLESLYGPLERVSVIRHGVRLSPIMDRITNQGTREPARILYVGRLSHEKGVGTLIEAANLLERGGLTFQLQIAGDGPLREALQTMVRRTNTTQVSFLGHRADVSSLMAQCDVVVIPSLRETLSLVALEALSSGRAVVASRTGGLPEIIENGVTGLLTPPGDAAALARALETILTDRELRERVARAGASQAAIAFTLNRMTEDTRRLYQRVHPSAEGEKLAIPDWLFLQSLGGNRYFSG